jgi:hypothetical protein
MLHITAGFLLPKDSIIGEDRNRLFLIIGGGYAFANSQGPLVEAGVEVRLFGNIHARLSLDHYFGGSKPKNGTIIKQMDGITIDAVYNKPLTETIEFRLKAGGHFTSARTQLTILGLQINGSEANIGYSAGAGFTLQISNKIYLYAETTAKRLLLQEPMTWLKGEIGIMYRLR